MGARVAAIALIAASCGAPAPVPKPPPAPKPSMLPMSRLEMRAVRADPAGGVIIGARAKLSKKLRLPNSARVAAPENPAPVAVAIAVATTLGQPVYSAVAGAEADSSAAAALSLLALRMGAELESVRVIGEVTLDGRIVPGAETVTPADGGQAKLVLVPAGSAAEARGPDTQIVPVRTLAEAFRAATGAELVETEPRREGAEQTSRANQDLARAAEDARNKIGRDYVGLLEVRTSVRAPASLALEATSALDAVAAAEKARRRGDEVGSWAEVVRASRHSRVAAVTHELLETVRGGEGELAVSLLSSERERVEARISAAAIALGPGMAGQLRALGAHAARYRALAWLWLADRYLPLLSAKLGELTPTDDAAGTVALTETLVGHAVPVLRLLARAESEAMEVEHIAGLPISTLVPAADISTLTALATRLAATSRPSPLPDEVPADWLAELRALPSSAPVDALEIPEAALERLALALTRAWSPPRLAPSEAQLAAGLVQLRRLAHRADVVLGAVPAEVDYRYSIAKALGSGDDDSQLEALVHIDRAALLAVVAVELALPPMPPRPTPAPVAP